MTFDEYFFNILDQVKRKSKDPSRKIAAVIVKDNQIISTGFNGLPCGVSDDLELEQDRYESPAKYKWTVHAEENAICIAAKNGHSTSDSTIYCTLYPCAKCARMLIQAGIAKLVCPEPDWDNDNYAYDFTISQQMLDEAKVEVEFYNH